MFENNDQNFNNYNINGNINNQNNMEQPPILSDIKPLNESITAQAPTEDALGPMNIMPESLPPANDINTNVVNNGQNETINNNQFQQPSFLNDNFSLNENQTSINNINQYKNNILETQNMQNESSTNMAIPDLNNNQNPIFPENLMQQDIPQNYNNIEQSNDIENEEKGIYNTVNDISLAQKEDNLNNDISISPSFEISDVSLNQNNEEEIKNLGLDSSYTNQDTLEIMDIDSDEKLNLKENNQENNLSTDKIRQLVEDLKNQGEKITLEEFDFDKITQLVIKIEK